MDRFVGELGLNFCRVEVFLFLYNNQLNSGFHLIPCQMSNGISSAKLDSQQLNKDRPTDITCFIISLFNAQHVSNVSTFIFRSLRLIC